MKVEVTFTGGRARKQAAAPPPFGPGFSTEIIEKTETLEVWGTEFKDPGPDYCEFRAIDANGVRIALKRLEGR